MALLSDLINKVKKRKDEVLGTLGSNVKFLASQQGRKYMGQNLSDVWTGKTYAPDVIGSYSKQAEKIKSPVVRNVTQAGLGRVRAGSNIVQGVADVAGPNRTKLQRGLGALGGVGGYWQTFTPTGALISTAEPMAFGALEAKRKGTNALEGAVSAPARNVYASNALGLENTGMGSVLDISTGLLLNKGYDKAILARDLGKISRAFDANDVETLTQYAKKYPKLFKDAKSLGLNFTSDAQRVKRATRARKEAKEYAKDKPDFMRLAKLAREGMRDLIYNNITEQPKMGFTKSIKGGTEGDLLKSVKRSSLAKKYNDDALEMIGKEARRMAESIEGVDLLPIEGGRYMRASRNPTWYKEFYSQYKRAPSNEELLTLAERNLRTGGGVEGFVGADPSEVRSLNEYLDLAKKQTESPKIKVKQPNQSKGNVSAGAEMPRMIKLKPQQAQSVKLNLKALPEPRGMVKGEGFTMYGKEYQDALKQGGKTIKIKQPLKSTEKVFRLIERQEKPAQASLQAEVLKHQDPDIAYRIWRLKEDRIKASPIFQDGYVKSLMNKLDDTKQIPQQMSATLADIEKRVYGSATPSGVDFQKGTKSGAGLVSNLIRRGEAGVSGVVGKGLQSESPIVRNVSRLLQGFGGGLGKTRQATEGTGTFKGGVDYAQKISHDTQQYIAGLVGKDAKALERIHAVLDPDLAKVKVSFDSLTPKEKEATEFLRQVSDYINDTNYKNGFISEELWQSHRGGKYLARAYEPFDYAPEIADFLKQSRIKMDLAPFKQRTDINDWKVDNAIRDPAYLVAKRLQQTMFNDEVLRTFNWLKGTDMVSQTPKAGFVQLSDHKSYGELAGKFVRKDVLDDIKGLYFVNDFGNKVYDVLRAYDRNPVRQTQKQILTIFNPAVRLGNNFGNFFFAHLNGINPITFAKNRAWASAESRGNGQLYRRMIKDGLLGTDTMKADIANFAQKIQAGYKDDSAVKKIIQSLQTRYGNADDVAKLSAMKTWLDRGYSYEESARRVYNGFQNYRTVGWLYDVGSKLPIFGNPFVRFQGDLQRIIKNSVVDHPVRAVGTLMLWKLFTDVMSTASGETPEDRATRESRVGAPRVPFTKVALEVQTPWGAVNAGRLLGYVAYTPVGGATATSDLARVLPVQLPDIGEAQEKNNPRIALKNLGSAPDIGPVLSVLADTDFRGKSVSDPNQNRYQNSLLSDDEKRANQLNFLARQYIPYLDDVQDTVASIKGEKDYYGRTKTPTQALLRTGVGLKVEKFGAKEAQETRLRNQSYDEKANEAINKSISAVKKQLLKGEIDESTANKRIQFFKKQQTQQGTASAGVAFAGGGSGNYTVDGDTLTYLKDNGDLDSIDLNLEVPTPKQTGNVELDKKRRSAYYGDITAKINDIVKLNELGVLTDEEAEALIIDLQEQKDTFQSKSGGGSGGSSKKIKIASPPKLSSIKLATPKTVKLDILKNTSSGQRIKLPQMRPPTPQSPKKTVSVRSLAKAFEKYK